MVIQEYIVYGKGVLRRHVLRFSLSYFNTQIACDVQYVRILYILKTFSVFTDKIGSRFAQFFCRLKKRHVGGFFLAAVAAPLIV